MRENMKKLAMIIMFLLLVFSLSPNIVNAVDTSYYDYVIDSYKVDIKVNENNTYDITETIDAYFNISKHGIFRTIPLNNTITRLDGTANMNRARVTNVKVNDNFTTSRENNNYKIKIGSADVTLTGKKQYKISYNYNIGKDRSDNYDELYFNIIGSEWDTTIDNVTFTITMPKDFDESKLGFSAGRIGSTDSSKITYNVDGNVITGKYNGVINPGEALTVRTELPEGYFVNAGYQIDLSTYLFFIIPIAGLLISIFLWYKYGKDEQVIETIEFYPPEGLNSLEIGYLYKGNASNQDVTSLLIYLANKGYIKISEKENKTLFGTKTSFEITKLRDYYGGNDNEKMFFKGLFKKKSTVTESDLYNSFYETMYKILENINSLKNNKKIFETTTTSKSLIVVLMILISLFTVIGIPSFEYAGEFWYALMEEEIFLKGFLLGVLCVAGMIVCLAVMPKRNKYGNEILGKIRGFKTFLETAEKEQLEAMVMKDPTYFYNILPYTYVLGVSKKWISKFETIGMQEPHWYGSSSNFDFNRFGTFMDNTMSSAGSAMMSSPSSSSGGSSGGFSGGGSSGGGSGGGGGGSW